ncbi:hypothetical protein [Segetibacter koreensis]|uniref:hypothetical protein n=1 Tax=Segetibacter koreensis TaxID=398037 RepID=UPI00037DD0C4|nr:hypothetical protein [Segetibacter koreensis]
MLKFNELKVGDFIMAEFEGQIKEGEITDVDTLDKKVCVLTADGQEFWYEPKHLKPLILDEAQLFKLGFQKHANSDGSAKYSKGAFRVLIHKPDDFSNFEMWYREDKRHIKQPIYLHDFQNKYLEMTKIHLTKD